MFTDQPDGAIEPDIEKQPQKKNTSKGAISRIADYKRGETLNVTKTFIIRHLMKDKSCTYIV